MDLNNNRHRKKRAHYSSVFFLGIAFLAFIVISLSVSLTIRACSCHQEFTQEDNPRKIELDFESEDIGSVRGAHTNVSYEMPDSVARICFPRPLEGVSEQIIRKTSYIVE